MILRAEEFRQRKQNNRKTATHGSGGVQKKEKAYTENEPWS